MNKKPPLIDKTLESNIVFNGEFLKVISDKVKHSDGSISIYEYVKHPGAAAVIAINHNNEIILERQFRHSVQREMIEIPAGKIDKCETDLDAAIRELLEETGYSAKNWEKLGECLPCIGYSNERIVYYLAKNLSYSQTQLDKGEFIETYALPIEECFKLAYSGKITDSKTLSGLMLYKGHLNKI